MNVFEKILSELRAEYDKGRSYSDVANSRNVSYSYMRDILTGKQDVGKISLEYLLKMFPNASINLHGNTVNVRSDNGSTAFGVIAGDVNNVGQIPRELISAVLADKSLSIAERAQLLKELYKK